MTAAVTTAVDHPLFAAQPIRTAGAWRKGVERFGETLAHGSLRLRGYEVINMKLPGNHGIDLIAVKRSADGTVADIRLVEVKTHYGAGPRLARRALGHKCRVSGWPTDCAPAFERRAGEETSLRDLTFPQGQRGSFGVPRRGP